MGADSLRVFNTMSGQKEPLSPLVPGQLGVYVCGPTVYGYVHIGNARTFTSFDVVVRYLRYRGFAVRYVRNYTDVDDKIIKAAKETGEAPLELAARFVNEFEADARALRLIAPDASPKVSEAIPEVVALIEKLIAQGVAYESHGDVYFQVSRWPGYAKLSKRNLEELREGERVTTGEQKREPLDFALWKAAKPNEPSWASPWGKGRPGWHIECSAMVAKYLGLPVDIHGGGRDLIFPHHENELAQSEAGYACPFCKVWMHAGFLDLDGAKMSKSLGNVVRLRDALGKVDAEALRYFFLSTHYRSPLAFGDKSLADAEVRLEYFYETLRKVDEKLAGAAVTEGPIHGEPRKFLREVEAQLDDDFNVPGGLGVLSGLFAEMNELADGKSPVKDKAMVARTLKALRQVVSTLAPALGLFEEAPTTWLAARRDRLVSARGLDRAQIEALLADRERARRDKQWAESDRLRDALKALGAEVKDTPQGQHWRVVTGEPKATGNPPV